MSISCMNCNHSLDIINSFKNINNDDLNRILKIIDDKYIINDDDIKTYLFKRYIDTKDQNFGKTVMSLIEVSIKTTPKNIISKTTNLADQADQADQARDTLELNDSDIKPISRKINDEIIETQDELLQQFYNVFDDEFDIDYKKVINLIKKGVDVNTIFTPKRFYPVEDTTILHIAIADLENKVVKTLIQLGANVNHIDKEGLSSLYLAVIYNNSTAVKILLEANVDINIKYKDEPILYSAVLNQGEHVFKYSLIIKRLLKAGADINAKNNKGESTLDFIKKHNNIKNISHFIKQLNFIKTVSSNSNSDIKPISRKINDENIETQDELLHEFRRIFNNKPIEIDYESAINLIEKGVDITTVLNPKYLQFKDVTMLHIAILKHENKIVKKLMHLKANINFTNNNGLSPLHVAALVNNIEAIELLLEAGASICIKFNHEPILYTVVVHQFNKFIGNNQIICRGTASNNLETIKLLVKAGAEITDKNDKGESTLDYIKSRKKCKNVNDILQYFIKVLTNKYIKELINPNIDFKLMIKLINYGVNVNTFNDDGTTILHIIAIKDRFDLIDEIINFGADIEDRNEDDETPLCTAVLFKNVKTVKKLIEVGANVNVTNEDCPILFDAVFKKSLDIVKLLVKAGSDVTCLYKDKNILDYTDNRLNETDDEIYDCIKEYLKKHIDNLLRKELNKYENYNFDKIINLINAGADSSIKTCGGCYILHLTILWKNKKLFDALIYNNVDININDSSNKTALHLASSTGQIDIVECLINTKIEIDAKDVYGATALLYAASAGHIDIIKCLINAGANINIKTNNNLTALDYAFINRHKDVIEYLESLITNIDDIKKLYDLYNDYYKIDWNDKIQRKHLCNYAESINNTEFYEKFK